MKHGKGGCRVKDEIIVYFCRKCAWCIFGPVGLPNECPNCRRRGLSFLKGSRDEVVTELDKIRTRMGQPSLSAIASGDSE